MHIVCERFPDNLSVLVSGYDPERDPEKEFCAVFRSTEEENTVQLVSRHFRSHGAPERCTILAVASREDRAIFEKMLPRFYEAAMLSFGFTAFDDSLHPKQIQLPLSEKSGDV